MLEIKFYLHPKYKEHIGLGYVLYRSKNEHGEALTYCLQENMGEIELLRCSKDGEPSYTITPKQGVKLIFEKLRPDGDKFLEKVNAFIDRISK